MIKAYYLANESLPYLIFEHRLEHVVLRKVEEFERRMKNPEAEEWWIYLETK